MAQPKPFNERLDVLPLYNERWRIAFSDRHRLEQQNREEIADVAGETYPRRIKLRVLRLSRRPGAGARARGAGRVSEHARGLDTDDGRSRVRAFASCRSSRPTIPGVRTQQVTRAEITRQVSLVSMSGQRFSPAVMTFIRAIRSHDWSGSSAAEAG
jgi:hypothetical protein